MMKENRNEAVALTFDPSNGDAPKVVAKGKGILADNILKKANENDIPIQQDASLVQILGQLDLNESIPEELYQAVAEVFAFIYQLDKKHGEMAKKMR